MSVLNENQLIGASAAGGDYEIEQSLRFEDSNSSILDRTPASASNRKTFTISFWMKRCGLGFENVIRAYSAGNDYDAIQFTNDNQIRYFGHEDSTNVTCTTNALYRDSSSWYHFLISVDTTQSTSSNRIKIYANGVLQTLGTATYPSLNEDLRFNSAVKHEFSEGGLNAYLAEFNFIDGLALTPDSFGETGSVYGEWKPKKYGGAYGTNGFFLPFKQDYTVEGFSTVLYEGHGTDGTPQYTGGVGFKPDLSWLKARIGGYNPVIFDSVRGSGAGYLQTDNTDDETAVHGFLTPKTDGFEVIRGTDAGALFVAKDDTDYVAWNWKMGNSSGIPNTISATGNVQHSTAQSKFGGSSIVFDGSGDFLDMPYSTDFNFAANDFTIEAWIKTSTTGTDMALVSMAYHNNSFGMSIGTDNKLRFQGNNPDGTVIGTTSVTDGAWYHVALVRDNNTLKVFVDGTLENSSTWTTSLTPATATRLTIGEEAYTGRRVPYNGFMDEVRISNSARYTSSFTPDTTVFSNDSNTILLIHSDTTNASTTFVDTSGAAVNTSGSITSYVSANVAYGQSIIKYTGNNTSGATVGHGLSAAPEFVFTKADENGYDWPVYHSGLASTSHTLTLNLDTLSGVETNKYNGTAPSSTVVTLGNHGTNRHTGQMMYAFHSVTGYSKFGSYSGNATADNAVTTGFTPAFLLIKRSDATGNWMIFDNVRNPTQPDGGTVKTIFANLTLAESDTYYGVQFTATGFNLQYNDSTTTNASGGTYMYAAFADTREYAFWLDQSGNNNDFASNDLDESDVMVDSPTNNFCTFNPLNRGYGLGELSEGNLNIYYSTAGSCLALGTLAPNSGKWYCEFTYIHGNAASDRTAVGIGNANENVRSSGNAGKTFMATTVGTNLNRVWLTDNVESDNNFPARPTGTIIQFAWDMDAGKAWMGTNNQWSNSSGGNISISDVVAGNNATVTDSGFSHVTPLSRLGAGGSLTNTHLLNCGQDSSFGGNKTAQGYADSNDIGDFFYPPPTGFLALCTKNLPDVDVIPSEHISTTLYAGNSTDNRVISGVGFTPDLGIFRRRTGGSSPAMWFDTVRGATLQSRSDANTAESVQANKQKTFTSDGYTLGTDAQINGTGKNHLVWNFKGGGAAVSNTNGSITSQVSANVAAGFSIATFTSITGVMTIGHGLSKAPELVTNQMTSSGSAWWTFHKDVGNTKAMRFTGTNSPGTSSNFWNNTSPSSTVVTLGAGTGGNAADAVMYCWHSVEGYSKVGIYDGNNDAGGDGTFVYLGFRPSWVMIKEKDVGTGNGEWNVWDSAREPSNPNDNMMALSADGQESVDNIYNHMDFLSNGFKLRETYNGSVGGGSQTNYTTDYIYLAFAETPFKYSNAR